MNLLTILAIIIVIGVIGASVYISTHKNEEGTHEIQTTSKTRTTEKTRTTTIKTTTTTTNANTTIGQQETNGTNPNIWDLTPEFTSIRLTHTTEPDSYPSPVLVDDKFYDFSYARFYFNYTIGNDSIVFNVTWRMVYTSYMATCYDFIDNVDVTREIPDALMVEYSYNFSDGYWIDIKIFMPANSTMLDFLNNLPFTDLESFATPHGAQIMVLGAIFRSSDPGSNGKWSSAQPLLSEDQMAACNPKTEGSPEAYSLEDKIGSLLVNHDIALEFMPFEFNNPMGLLSEINRVIEGSGGGDVYDTYYYKVIPTGKLMYPGTNITTTLYNITFWTEPDYVHGHYLVIAESIIPVEYRAVFPQGDQLDGVPVSVTIKLTDAKLRFYSTLNRSP